MDIKKLTIDEKLKLLCGASGWTTNDLGGKINKVFMSDGPHGVRRADGNGKESTAMPNLVTVANSWSKEAAYLQGKTIADDCIAQDVDLLLAPGVNIKRTPLNGRNFEYFSEDPFLAGTLGRAYIEGVQDKGVGTSLKHFCANNRETDRLAQSNELDDRALYEIYLKSFEIALKGKPWSVMCSYNPVNGIFASENKKLLKGILRGKLGFEGTIISDWDAVHNHYKAARAGCDLEMPYSETSFEELKDAYEKGWLEEKDIDFCVNNVLKLIEKKEKAKEIKKVEFTREQRHRHAIEIAEEGIVLLKNEGILPLTSGKIGVYGEMSEYPVLGGGGSANVANCNYDIKPLKHFIKENLGDACTICDCKGWYMGNILGLRRMQCCKPAMLEAYDVDYVIVTVGNRSELEREDTDREDIELPRNHTEFIRRIARYNDNLIVIVQAGSAVNLEEIKEYAKAIIFAGYAGEGANEALADIITGKVVPSGKLAETFPLSLEDTAVGDDYGDGIADRYYDGIFVGYRYYDSYGVEVSYPFGYGLSYTEFEYSNLKVEKIGETDYIVSYDIENKGKRDAKEVSQVYVKDVFSMVCRPEKELKGFSKDLIKAGEKKRISVKLDFSSFAYYSTAIDDWMIENGAFEILVGASSEDIRLKEKITIELDDRFQPTQM